MIKIDPVNTSHLSECELAGAVTRCHALDLPLVAEPGHHLGHLGVGDVDKVESAEYRINLRGELDRRFQYLLDAGMRTADKEDAALLRFDHKRDFVHSNRARPLRS